MAIVPYKIDLWSYIIILFIIDSFQDNIKCEKTNFVSFYWIYHKPAKTIPSSVQSGHETQVASFQDVVVDRH